MASDPRIAAIPRVRALAKAIAHRFALFSPDGTVTWPPLPTPEPT